jgi:hypothetical protein
MLPAGHEEVHQGDEAGVVSGFDQVRHFVDDDVFEAFARFLGQVRIEPDGGGAGGAATPFGFHLLNEEALHVHGHERLPFRDQRGDRLFQLSAIPLVEDGRFLLLGGGRANLQDHAAVT